MPIESKPRDDTEQREREAEELRTLVEKLGQERDQLAAELEQRQSLQRSLADQLSEPGDSADAAVVQREIDRLEPLVQRGAERLDGLQRLLERAAQGRVAICDRCGGPIPFERLLIVPGTTFCADCMEDVEREERREEAAGVTDVE